MTELGGIGLMHFHVGDMDVDVAVSVIVVID
jgi:hypothetical protein